MNPVRTRDPSNGGIGMRLKDARMMFIWAKYSSIVPNGPYGERYSWRSTARKARMMLVMIPAEEIRINPNR